MFHSAYQHHQLQCFVCVSSRRFGVSLLQFWRPTERLQKNDSKQLEQNEFTSTQEEHCFKKNGKFNIMYIDKTQFHTCARRTKAHLLSSVVNKRVPNQCCGCRENVRQSLFARIQFWIVFLHFNCTMKENNFLAFNFECPTKETYKTEHTQIIWFLTTESSKHEVSPTCFTPTCTIVSVNHLYLPTRHFPNKNI